jgi:hypothetical protein
MAGASWYLSNTTPLPILKIYVFITPLVPILGQMNPVHAPILFLENPVQYYIPIHSYVSQVVSFPQVSPSNPHLFFPKHLPHA